MHQHSQKRAAILSFKWFHHSNGNSHLLTKTAFLRGKADENNPLAMEPPVELRKKLQLGDDQVCKLVGNAYGRVDAPLLFFKELGKQLKELHFKVHPLEPCIHYLESIQDGRRTLHGVLGTHVDDGLCGGDDWFHEQLNKLRQKLPFGSFKPENLHLLEFNWNSSLTLALGPIKESI